MLVSTCKSAFACTRSTRIPFVKSCHKLGSLALFARLPFLSIRNHSSKNISFSHTSQPSYTALKRYYSMAPKPKSDGSNARFNSKSKSIPNAAASAPGSGGRRGGVSWVTIAAISMVTAGISVYMYNNLDRFGSKADKPVDSQILHTSQTAATAKGAPGPQKYNNRFEPASATANSEIIQAIEEMRSLNGEILSGTGGRSRHIKAASSDLQFLNESQVAAVIDYNANAFLVLPGPLDRNLGEKQLPQPHYKVFSNQVASNSRIEDYITFASPPTAPGKVFFGVFDGHAGYQCAEKLSSEMPSLLDSAYKTINTIIERRDFNDPSFGPNNRQIEYQGKGSSNIPTNTGGINGADLPSRLAGLIKKFSNGDFNTLKENMNSVALVSTFVLMDEIVVFDGLKQVISQDSPNKVGAKNPNSPNIDLDLDKLLGPAVAGSCGLGAVLDSASNTITVANTGDSRAVLGRNTGPGIWKAIPLSQDQTADNAEEVRRLRAEHPGEEQTVLVRGRVLGNLMPTRAFGDCRYKWPLEVQQQLFPVLYNNGHRYATIPNFFKSPPYVTAQPIMLTHNLTPSDKFVVMASDGLYDRMGNNQIVAAVGEWLDSNLLSSEQNLSSKLIKLALNTNDYGNFSSDLSNQLLAIPPPYSRRLRDDISVFVIVL